MKYAHPKPSVKPAKEERSALLKEYFDLCRHQAAQDAGALNRKVPREAFRDLHERVGLLLLDEAKKLATEAGPIRDFLDVNPLPERMRRFLPDEYRAFSLVLNSLKQWTVKEVATTDRYLLGARAREECKAAASFCVLSGADLRGQHVELHHTVRDGRPPIPLTKEAHSKLEDQVKPSEGDPVGEKLRAARSKLNRPWVFIRLGCQALLNQAVHDTAKAPAAKSVARRICRDTGLSEREILAWLDEHVE